LANSYQDFLSQAAAVNDLDVVKRLVIETTAGKPIEEQTAKGFNFGLYVKFANKKDYDEYQADKEHIE